MKWLPWWQNKGIGMCRLSKETDFVNNILFLFKNLREINPTFECCFIDQLCLIAPLPKTYNTNG